jgi:16S rRNA (cytosine967-C5)-methyltransferase
LDPLLERVLGQRSLSGLDRAFITELVYGVLRQQGYLDWVISQRTTRPLSKLSTRLRTLVRIGAYQILFLSKVPDSAAVNESVKLAKAIGGKPVAGFVNALLRNISRKKTFQFPDLHSDPIGYVASRYSHPPWIVKRWIDRYGTERTIKLCESNNSAAPLTIRTNTMATTRGQLQKSLEADGIISMPCPVAPEGLWLKLSSSASGVSLASLEAYRRGWFYVQDEAAQLIGQIVDPKPHERVLDVCAAPGGKATHLAELMENRGEMIAVDVSRNRLKRMTENIQRLGINMIHSCVADATQDLRDLGVGSFDRILVDAPCSGLGLLRRNPEGRWKKTDELTRYYAPIQQKILQQVAPLLKTGGILVYSTCTTEPEENENVVEAFRKTHTSFQIKDLREVLPKAASGLVTPEGILNTLFNPFQMDHFFAVMMVKEL